MTDISPPPEKALASYKRFKVLHMSPSFRGNLRLYDRMFYSGTQNSNVVGEWRLDAKTFRVLIVEAWWDSASSVSPQLPGLIEILIRMKTGHPPSLVSIPLPSHAKIPQSLPKAMNISFPGHQYHAAAIPKSLGHLDLSCNLRF